MDFTRSPKRMRRTAMILPMINVLFIVMVFVALSAQTGSLQASTTQPTAFTLPTSVNGMEVASKPLTITVTAKGELLLDGSVVSLTQWNLKIAETLKAESNTAIVLQLDAALDSRRLLDVLQMIQKAGGRNVSIAVKSPPVEGS
jgi:biopolymer transport protein ExbD